MKLRIIYNPCSGRAGRTARLKPLLSDFIAARRLDADLATTEGPGHATALAREAIDLWLRLQLRKARHQAIAAYAGEMAGTNFDLDPVLEAAAIEHLAKTGKEPQ